MGTLIWGVMTYICIVLETDSTKLVTDTYKVTYEVTDKKNKPITTDKFR